MATFRGKQIADKYVRYRCGTCDELHEDDYEAQHCCGPEKVLVCPVCDEIYHSVDELMACHPATTEITAQTCPVCRSTHDTTDAAVDCCQWKTMDFGDRYRLARQLEQTVY